MYMWASRQQYTRGSRCNIVPNSCCGNWPKGLAPTTTPTTKLSRSTQNMRFGLSGHSHYVLVQHWCKFASCCKTKARPVIHTSRQQRGIGCRTQHVFCDLISPGVVLGSRYRSSRVRWASDYRSSASIISLSSVCAAAAAVLVSCCVAWLRDRRFHRPVGFCIRFLAAADWCG